MNAYMYHMLLKAREVHRYNHSRPMGAIPKDCPFCAADCESATSEARNHMITMELSCWKCPLLTLVSHDDPREVMEDCETLGRHALWVYENSAGSVLEEEVLC
jgi:hypothetical protein